MEKKIAHSISIRVNGFENARAWMKTLIRAKVCKCDSCANPATHVWFQDRAEYYYRCEDHRQDQDQWGGSTRWQGNTVAIPVVSKEVAQSWLDTLESHERRLMTLDEYDATDYYELMYDDFRKARHYVIGGEDVEGFYKCVDVYPLTNGEFAYEITQGHQHKHGGSSWSYGIKGAWLTEQEALDDARQAIETGTYQE